MRWMIVVALWLAELSASGCLHPNTVSCGDGAQCPTGMECTVGGCAMPGNVLACSGLVSGAGCTTDTGSAGVCTGGACQATAWTATAVIGGNVAATAVALPQPYGIALDVDGNVYVVEQYDAQIVRVDATGVVIPVAGTGGSGYSGDGGPATEAQLSNPTGVAIDGLGNLYIADTQNSCIRRVDAFGVITTVAGTGGTSGSGGDTGPAVLAQLDAPAGVAVDGFGNLYIADTGNSLIRRVDATTGIITTIVGTTSAGSGEDQLDLPQDVTIDSQGNLYVADTLNDRILRVDGSTGAITTFAGTGSAGYSGDGGSATEATMNLPTSVAVDEQGDVFIADTTNERIRRVDVTTRIITTSAGNGTSGYAGDGGAAIQATLSSPQGVAVDAAGNVYITDTSNDRARRVNSTGIIETIAGTGANASIGDGGAATSATLSQPQGLAVDAVGDVFIADTSDERVRRVDTAGVITTVAGTGAFGYGGDNGSAVDAKLAIPVGLAVDGNGDLYIADLGNNRIRRVDGSGTITTIAGTGETGYSGDGSAAINAELEEPNAVAVDEQGALYIADSGNSCIRRVSSAGIITTFAGTGVGGFSGDGSSAIDAQLATPSSVALDGSGDLYIADTENGRVRRVGPSGIITTVAGNGSSGSSGDGGPATSADVNPPEGVAVNAQSNLYIADDSYDVIRRVDTAGIISTFAGTGSPGYGGDGGDAASAQLQGPRLLAFDSLGNLYIADPENAMVRRVDTAGITTTIAGTIDPAGMGPITQARLADPIALVVTPSFTLFAGGVAGIVERATTTTLDVVIGRYPQPSPALGTVPATGNLARFQGTSFGTVSGVAYDPAGYIYLTQSSANQVDVVTIVDAADVNSWTIATLANVNGTFGFADGAAAAAQFRNPTGLYLDAGTQQLYVADTGNHVVRAIDLATNQVSTVAGTPEQRGYFGDGGAPTASLLYEPQAITECPNGDLFIADTGNDRIRRVSGPKISTVLGDGTAASSGQGTPASTFPVNAPLGLACDALGDVFASSTTTVRFLPADGSGVVDGTGGVQTIYGAQSPAQFPASVTRCLAGIAVVDANTVRVIDSCTGLLVELVRGTLQSPT